MKTFKCTGCKELKFEDEFYYHTNTTKTKITRCSRCKICHNEYNRQKSLKKKLERGGSTKIHLKPGKFDDDAQRKQVHDLLLVIGWETDGNNNWWKDGVKSREGIWARYKVPFKETQKELKRKAREMVTGDTVPYVKMKYKQRQDGPTQNQVDNIIWDYFVEKKQTIVISREMNISESVINSWVKHAYNQLLPKEYWIDTSKKKKIK